MPCFFFLDNEITGSKCLKPAIICRIAKGIYTLSKKIVTVSGVWSDLINYCSLCSPYDTVLCNNYGKKVTQLTLCHNAHLKIKKKKYCNKWP